MTSAVVAKQSFAAWVTCIGVISIANGVLNLLPVPVLNGGRLIIETYQAVFGPVREAAFVGMSYLGLALVLIVMGRVVWLDVTWLIGLF